MIERLELLHRFWDLRSRNASAGRPLTPAEQSELLTALSLSDADEALPPIDGLSGRADSIPAELEFEDEVLEASLFRIAPTLILASTGGVAVRGAQVTVRVRCALSGVEYTLPCVVRFVHRGVSPLIALSVEGVPHRNVFARAPAHREAVRVAAAPASFA